MTGLIERLWGDLPETIVEKHNVTDYDAVIGQNREAADALEALKGYAVHRVGCFGGLAEVKCECGLSALLAKLGDA